MENMNDAKYLEGVKIRLFETLRELESAPGVQIQTGAHMDVCDSRNTGVTCT